MVKPSIIDQSARAKAAAAASRPVGNYFQIALYRKWVVLAIFFVVTVVTIIVVQSLPNVFTAQTLILVDPQKVPEKYVSATIVTDPHGRMVATPFPVQDSAMLRRLALADALVLRAPNAPALPEGSEVTVIRLDSLGL